MDFDVIRAEFPITKEMAYFDIAYGNPLPDCVREAMVNFLIHLQRRGVSIVRPIALQLIHEV